MSYVQLLSLVFDVLLVFELPCPLTLRQIGLQSMSVSHVLLCFRVSGCCCCSCCRISFGVPCGSSSYCRLSFRSRFGLVSMSRLLGVSVIWSFLLCLVVCLSCPVYFVCTLNPPKVRCFVIGFFSMMEYTCTPVFTTFPHMFFFDL